MAVLEARLQKGMKGATFEYVYAWQENPNRLALEPFLKLGPGPFETPFVHSFRFANDFTRKLPESSHLPGCRCAQLCWRAPCLSRSIQQLLFTLP
jgi:hypothetical protein